MSSKHNRIIYTHAFLLSQTFQVYVEDVSSRVPCFLKYGVFLKYDGADKICKWLNPKNLLLCKEVIHVTYVAACHNVCQLQNVVNGYTPKVNFC